MITVKLFVILLTVSVVCGKAVKLNINSYNDVRETNEYSLDCDNKDASYQTADIHGISKNMRNVYY